MINAIQQRNNCYNPGAIAWNCPQRFDKLVRFDSYPEYTDRFTELRIDSDRCLNITGGSFEPKIPGMPGGSFRAQQ